MGLAVKIVGTPPINRIVFKILKDRVFKPYQISLGETLEKQRRILKEKFIRMENTEIGKKIGIHRGAKLEELPITDYELYEPFFNNPSPSAFMFPIEEYIKVRTSGTAGKEKWLMTPRRRLRNLWQTGITVIFTIFHDGEKITLRCGDNVYVNVAPRPLMSGTVLSVGGGKTPLFNLVPNINLSYKDKIQYFINNHEKIDGAVLLASSLVSEIIPAIKKPIKLKGLNILDSPMGELYKDEIESFTGTTPKAAYGSTETGFCAVPSIQYPLGFFFDWRRGIFEFLPIKKGEAKGKPVSINEVQVGEIYRLIYTDLESELTRYGTKDSFKCIAKGDDILGIESPIFKFNARTEKTISLNNFTRISEEEILTALIHANIPFIDFAARAEVEKGLEYLAMYIEPTREKTAEEIQRLLHEQLYTEDRDYRELANFFGYTPIKVHIVPKGTFALYLQDKVATIPKVDRINMEEKEFKKLIKLIKKNNLK